MQQQFYFNQFFFLFFKFNTLHWGSIKRLHFFNIVPAGGGPLHAWASTK